MNLSLLITIQDLFNKNAINLPLPGLQQVGLDEGLKLVAYQDEFGKWTIGLGHTPAYQGEVWTLDKAFSQFITDINTDGLNPVEQNFPWIDAQGIIRKWVLVNMSYNEGIDNLLAFTDTLKAMQNLDLHQVMLGMMDSLWYRQVTTRARQLMFQYWKNVWCITPLTSNQDRLLSTFINSGV